MRRLRLSVLLACAAIAAVLPGCVELDGQRLSWRYDAAKDELVILLHYDGVHDSGSDQHGEGAKQLPEFVLAGDVMFLDWPFHFQREKIRQAAENPIFVTDNRPLARVLLKCKTEPIGYYREPDGKLGAAQRIVIPNAKAFVAAVNVYLNGTISQANDATYPRTAKRMREAARQGHQWLALDGQSFRITLPVHRGEWELMKGQSLAELIDEIVETSTDRSDDERSDIGKRLMRLSLELLASAPLSLVDKGDQIEITLGRTDSPSTLRLAIRDEYEPSLESVLADAVKTDLDAALADALLDENVKPSEAIASLIAFGPPEEQVRALLAVIDDAESARRDAAVVKLNAWAARWNKEQGVPEAPTGLDRQEPDPTGWKAWYAAMKRYPLPETPSPPVEKTTEETQPSPP
ncbi:MAG: hypothetical protein JW809_02715 [Pirellulales bacterium]|nr:hypothetical protein [Pirellulales bacterium]